MSDFLHWPGNRLDSAGSSRSDSPFWNAIEKIKTDSETLRVACPYLAPAYVEDLVESVEDWRLVTDVQAWTRVYGGEKETAIRNFIRVHSERIRHYPGLHAKIVVSDESAVFGSANLTRNGMVERQELGVRVDATEHVADLRKWFDDVWTTGMTVDENILPDASEGKGPLQEDETSGGHDEFDRLERAPNREWIELLLDLMQEAILVANLGESDPRLVTSVAQDDRMVVTVNSRYVCGGYFDGSPKVGLILADGFDRVDEVVQSVHPNDYYQFSTRDGRDPHWIRFDQHPEDALSSGIRPAWESAIENEVRRGTQSQYREHHDRRVYRLIMENDYREDVLREKF